MAEIEGDNRTDDMKVDDTILKLAEQYVGYENRARQINKDKAGVREQAQKIGIPSLAWQMGVRMVKIMDKDDRRDFEKGFRRVATVLDKSATTLFADDIERRDKRKARAKEKAAKDAAKAGKETPEQQERRLAADANPRSDPKRGGAGKKKSKGAAVTIISESDVTETGDELIARVSAEKNAELEQREGEAILSQSEQAAKKRADAGIP